MSVALFVGVIMLSLGTLRASQDSRKTRQDTHVIAGGTGQVTGWSLIYIGCLKPNITLVL